MAEPTQRRLGDTTQDAQPPTDPPQEDARPPEGAVPQEVEPTEFGHVGRIGRWIASAFRRGPAGS